MRGCRFDGHDAQVHSAADAAHMGAPTLRAVDIYGAGGGSACALRTRGDAAADGRASMVDAAGLRAGCWRSGARTRGLIRVGDALFRLS